jgi:hypothetical protein
VPFFRLPFSDVLRTVVGISVFKFNLNRKMKNFKLLLHLFLLGLVGLLVSSLTWGVREPESPTQNVTSYQPVYMSRLELNQSVQTKIARPLVQPGKIYSYGQYIFVNEKYKGIHVIDNADPQNPVNVSFINIPGNLDMAIKGNVLFADNASDLVALNISDLQNVQVIQRKENVFPSLSPPDGQWNYHTNYHGQIIIGWEKIN